MNVGFEAKRLFTNYTGLGNYARFVVDALSRFQPDNHYYLFTPRQLQNAEVAAITDRANVNVVSPSGLYAQKLFSALWRTWAMTKNENAKSLDIFHGLSQELPIGLPEKVKTIVTVHDLIFLRYPQFYNPIDVRIYHKKVKKACEVADCIVAISEQTADDIRKLIDPALASKIKVVYQGCHPIFRKKVDITDREQVRRKYQLPERFILNVGTVEERKNLIALVRAIGSLPERDRVPVIAVGRPTDYVKMVQKEIDRLGVGLWVKFLYPVPFEDLPALYQLSSLFVYPSLFEGFGIPIIEAIISGVPVISSTGSCFREAGGPNSIYVDPHDADELGRQISRVLSDSELREEMIRKSQEFIAKFEPQQIAIALDTIYRQIARPLSTS